jgi:hypothetical protein
MGKFGQHYSQSGGARTFHEIFTGDIHGTSCVTDQFTRIGFAAHAGYKEEASFKRLPLVAAR